MKNIFTRLLLIPMLVAFIFTACDSEGVVRDYGVTPVQKLYTPDNGKAIELQPQGTLFFEWEPALAEDGGNPLYEVVFDRENGNFSEPVAHMVSDNNGMDPQVTLTHKQINRIAAQAGMEAEEQGTLKWTIYSSKGYMPVKALEERTLTVTRLAGFANIPEQVYLTGEATEGGTNISNALPLKMLSEGEFEIYTKLLANVPFHFTDETSEGARIFSTDDGLLYEEGSSSVAQEGVYRIELDFTTGSANYTFIESIGFFFSPTNEVLFDLPYVGDGIFRAEAQTVTFKQESWGRDERYKFKMFGRDNAGEGELQEFEWGTLNPTDSRPTPDSPDSYYYIDLVTPSQWDNKWKLMGDFDGVPADYTIYLQADKNYTHSVTLPEGEGGDGGDEDIDDDVIRILAIGNSFSEDAIEQYLYELAKADGQELIIGNMYIGGSALELHWNNARNNAASYSYRKIMDGQKNTVSNSNTIEHALKDERWDYISFQQVSQHSGQFNTYFPYLTNLITYARNLTTNPDVEFILHQTWAYAEHSNHSGFAGYGNNQMTMYNAIVDAAEKAAETAGIGIIIPAGTAIQNGRTSLLGDTFDRDGYHLETTYGRFTAACAWYEKLFDGDVTANGYSPSGLSSINAEIAKNAAKLAVANPDRVTSMADQWGDAPTVDFTRPIYINTGGSSASTEAPFWNSMTSYETNSTIRYLVDEENNYTNVSVTITDRFGGINGDGPTTTQTSLNLPDWVSRNSFWGNGEGVFSGQSEPTGEFLFSGLDPSGEFEFNLFSARSGVSDNRETRFTITGAETLTADVNSSSNSSELATFTLAPNTNGEIKLKLEAGPNNTNGSKFFYINAISIVPK